MVDVFGWIENLWFSITNTQRVYDLVSTSKSLEELENNWSGLSDREKALPMVQGAYDGRKRALSLFETFGGDPVKQLVSHSLDQWLEIVKKYENAKPDQAKENLIKITAEAMKISASTAAAEFAISKLPWMNGQVVSGISRNTLSWLGFAAVITAVAHDPVKIGILRPYQDSLEQTFRNRRPDDFGLFQAYRTRELSPTKVGDLGALDDKVMDQIEAENDKIYNAEISKWGYSEAYAGALSRSATNTLNFGSLTQLARQGLLSRGLAIYSLWGAGLDKTVMKPALDALMAQNKMASYEGFRSMVEPAYIEGDIDELDLIAYWDRIMVPKEVQTWILPRLKKKRQSYKLKQAGSTAAKERDLTVSQIQAAYQNTLMDRPKAQNMILDLGYSTDEARILLDLAELRRKLPTSSALKRLPLSDYEKAFKNKLIDQDAVLARMAGEYSSEDIALEKRLLESGKA